MAGSSWQVLVGEGHAPEQVTLFCAERNLLLAADQILPRISPVIGVWAAEPDADPLGDFLRSLAQYRDLPEDCRVLPCARRCRSWGCTSGWRQLAPHHDERLERTAGRLCASRRPPPTCCGGCSPGRSTRIRPGSRWPRRWRTSIGCCASGRLERWADEPTAPLLYRAL